MGVLGVVNSGYLNFSVNYTKEVTRKKVTSVCWNPSSNRGRHVMGYSRMADLVVIAHLACAGFVLFGFLLIVVGGIFGSAWTHEKRFRITHLICILFVALEALLGVDCPLTILENQLLRAAGKSGYDRSFIGHLANQLLFYDDPEWVFTMVYVTLAFLSLLAYLILPSFRKNRPTKKGSGS